MEKSNAVQYLASHQWIMVLAILWTLPWKGAALWKAARRQSLAWFIALLILNTLGILDILYIFIFSRGKAIEDVFEERIEITERKVIDIKQEKVPPSAG